MAPGISVKLSALHPRYEWTHAEEAKAAIVPIVRALVIVVVVALLAVTLPLALRHVSRAEAGERANAFVVGPGATSARRVCGGLALRVGGACQPA